VDGRRRNDVDTKDIIKLYVEERLSMRKIADQLDVSFGLVQDRLRQAQVTARSKGDRPSKKTGRKRSGTTKSAGPTTPEE
jgi:transposase-like protein